jgi:hypothetical protein
MRFVHAGAMLLGAVVWLFVVVAILNVTLDTLWIVLAVIIGWNILLIVATILTIIDSVRKVRAKRTRTLATDVFVVKLAAIPFFLINFTLLAMVALLGVGLMRIGGFVLLFAVPLEIGLTYLAMISTSIYGWASIVQLRRERAIGTGLAVLYGIMLAIFVTDIVAGIMLFGHSRRRPGFALFIVFMVLGLTLLSVQAFLVPGIELLGLGFLVEGVTWLDVAGIAVIVATVVVAVVVRTRRRRRAGEIGPSEVEVAVEAAEGSGVDKS